MTAPSAPSGVDEQIGLFVYGTLLPGEERWRFLEPFVCSGGVECAVAGDLYDTGFGYPAAIFDRDPRYVGGTVRGRLFQLRPEQHREAIDLLDVVEGAVAGMYRRTLISVDGDTAAWAYQVGDNVALTPIVGGAWQEWAQTAAALPNPTNAP